jgi:transglycosylase-like protein
MHFGALTTKQYVIAAAVTALIFFLLGVAAAQAGAATATGGVGSGGTSSSPAASTTPAQDAERVAPRYTRIWNHLALRDKRWAHSTAACESGGDPNAIGGGGIYRGAFQFTRSTWKTSPKSPGGDPIAYPYKTQAVVAVLLMHREGTGPWPVCG